MRKLGHSTRIIALVALAGAVTAVAVGVAGAGDESPRRYHDQWGGEYVCCAAGGAVGVAAWFGVRLSVAVQRGGVGRGDRVDYLAYG